MHNTLPLDRVFLGGGDLDVHYCKRRKPLNTPRRQCDAGISLLTMVWYVQVFLRTTYCRRKYRDVEEGKLLRGYCCMSLVSSAPVELLARQALREKSVIFLSLGSALLAG